MTPSFRKHAPIRQKFLIMGGIYTLLAAVPVATTAGALYGVASAPVLLGLAAAALVLTIVMSAVFRSAVCDPYVASVVRMEGIAAGGFEQRAGVEQWQADHARMAARQEADERLGAALDRIAAGLAQPFAAGDVGVDLARLQPLEGDDGVGDTDARLAIRHQQADGGQAVMAPARQQAQQLALNVFGRGGRQDAAAERDGRVAGQHDGALLRTDRARLRLGKA